MIVKKEISFLTFGMLLVIIGAVLKISKGPQANLVLATGLVFELLAAILFIWKKLKNK